MKTLLINAQPDFRNQAHYSMQLQQLFINQFKKTFPNEQLTLLNLYDLDIPQLTEADLLGIWEKQAQHLQLTPWEQHHAEISEQLLAQFMDHHRIVIVMPLHNFNVPTRLKDYLDNILIAKKTFKYTEDGSVGLLTNDYRVMLLQASGSIYTNHDRYTNLEFSRLYLDAMFTNLMGMSSFQIVRAQGTATRSAAEVMNEAAQNLSTEFAQFYQLSAQAITA